MRTQGGYVLAASRPCYREVVERLRQVTGAPFHFAASPEELAKLELEALAPRYIFVPHWSWILPESVWGKYETIIFHMTDLPFGRGGSPLQNLIVRGFTETKLTALRCTGELDAGPVYLRKPLSLYGSAEEILLRAASAVEEMILFMIQASPPLIPQPQTGEPVFFKRRTAREGDMADLETLESIFNHIRMLDAEGYPPAFLRIGRLKLEFSRASLRPGRIEADVRILFEDE